MEPDPLVLPNAVEPTEWFAVFHTRPTNRWLSIAAFGKYKHVSAFAYYPGFKAWLVYDVCLVGTKIIMLRHPEAKDVLAKYVEGCTVLKIARDNRHYGFSPFSRLFFYCVPAVKNILGLRCIAMRPDALYRHILRQGGVCVYEQPKHSG